MKNGQKTLVSIFVLFLLWILLSTLMQNDLIMPTPWDTLKALGGLFMTSKGLSAIAMTLFRLIVSLSIATLLGLSLGVITGLKPHFKAFFSPIVSVLRTVPVISIVVIMLMIFGFTLTPYLITFLMIFPIIYQGVSDALESLDEELIDVYRLENDDWIDGLKYCYLPLIQTSIKTALLQSAGLGIKVLVMAEYLAQTKTSIGNALYLAKVNLDYASVFAWTLLLIGLAMVIEWLIRDRTQSFKTKIQKNRYSRE